MGRRVAAIIFVGLLAANTAFAQSICAGAEGASEVCASACSYDIVNENGSNEGKFNSGSNNQGDGNDGFNNKGSFNIGSGNLGDCSLGSGLTGGSCDVSNNNGQIVLRFCSVYPGDGKCQPGGYLPQFTPALISAIEVVVASCANGTPIVLPPTAPVTPSPTGAVPPAQPPSATPPTVTPPTPPALGPGALPVPGNGKHDHKDVDAATFFKALAEGLQLATSGRKMK